MPNDAFVKQLTQLVEEEETMQIEWTVSELQWILQCLNTVSVQGLNNQQANTALARKVDAAIKQAQLHSETQAVQEEPVRDEQE